MGRKLKKTIDRPVVSKHLGQNVLQISAENQPNQTRSNKTKFKKKKPKHQSDPFNSQVVLKELRNNSLKSLNPRAQELIGKIKGINKNLTELRKFKEPNTFPSDLPENFFQSDKEKRLDLKPSEILSNHNESKEDEDDMDLNDDPDDSSEQNEEENFLCSDDENEKDEDEDQGAILNLSQFQAANQNGGDNNQDRQSDDESQSDPESDAVQLKRLFKDSNGRVDAAMVQLAGGELMRTSVNDFGSLDQQIQLLSRKLASKWPANENSSETRIPRRQLRFRLLDLLCERFCYAHLLMIKLYDLFPNDLLEFLEANEVDRPVTLRVNTLKTRRKDLIKALVSRGMSCSLVGLDWSAVGLVIEASNVPHGATPEYLCGHYVVQGMSSLLPVMALDPQSDERVLDLCAAPGMKTTYIAQLMRNSGVLIANDIKANRCQAIVGNCHRLGVSNVVVTCLDGLEVHRCVNNFDRVLLDAPCSGTGIISKDASIKTLRGDKKDLQRSVHQQKILLKAALDCCKVGGVVVYSTCSLLVEENEHVVNFALKKRLARLVEVDSRLPGEPGFKQFKGVSFHPDLVKARRIYPHRHNMDGFFYAKMIKLQQ